MLDCRPACDSTDHEFLVKNMCCYTNRSLSRSVARSLRQQGLTLIELMIVIALLGVVMAIAAPNYQEFVRNSRLATASDELLTNMMLAKTEAIKRNGVVIVCNSSDPTAAAPSCVADNPNWKTGWIVFVSKDGNGTFDEDEDELIRVTAGSANIGSVTGPDDVISVTFRSITLSGGDKEFKFCTEGAASRIVTVEKTGRIFRTLGPTCT
ncbi:GspH/FimT family pseudopilin [Chitinimonas taiwanensis]|uniref:Type II secretion system protein H n=1 Tax=Chitinimonas taiwanensis DSM 18899 TaxID=1121279 RepID=A0A1K2HK51_9NEIS|nr:GspH/FimT family pseudopilin [Chitinimonas taiwanensis]SFZ77200.1 type IV fimbrial biogenesis protein FimT [Chitinimonas taiwanensis DSM 18899]